MLVSIEKGQFLTFRGKVYSVNNVNDSSDLVWLMPEPRNQDVCVSVYGKSMVLSEAEPATNANFVPKHTKSEIDARLDELNTVLDKVKENVRYSANSSGERSRDFLIERIRQLEKEREKAPDDIFSSIVESHKILCGIKQMDEKEAYGQNPAFYYGAAVNGEAGEMVNKMVKALRNGGDATDELLLAVCSELPDIVIYSFVLAYVLDVDLTRLVSEKANVVINRARSGYYGGPLTRPTT
jgi:hypothetical protein